jgi:hypothetical protein
VRYATWHGARRGDPVVVNGEKERRGGRVGESKGRSFRPELIFPASAKKGARVVGLSLASAPQFTLD